MTKMAGSALVWLGLIFSTPGLAERQAGSVGVVLTCRVSADAIELRAALRNVGKSDTAIALGSVLANGKKYLADAVSADISNAGGTTRFRYGDPTVPIVAGRVDPWVITLPVDSKFVLEWPLSHFWTHGMLLSDEPQPYDVRIDVVARSVPRAFGIPDFKLFVGEFRSAWIRVPDDCESKR